MKNNKQNSSHGTILKGTGVFGMMQFTKMAIGVVGAKFVAIFLGPAGIGIVGLLMNTLNIIGSLTNFGFAVTSVRQIAVAEADENPDALPKMIFVLQRIALFTGLLGAILTIAFSKLLSQWTFGNSDYTMWFIALSINFFLTSYTTSRGAILQGRRMIKSIAFSTVIASAAITAVTISLYYFLGFDGIVLVILLSSLINLIVNAYYTRKFESQKFAEGFSKLYQESLPVLKLGLLLSINVIFGYICTFLIKLYLNNNGESSQILGFYEISTVFLLSYVGLIFTSMSMDFYPRLTAVNSDRKTVNKLVNDQIEIALLLITPAIIFLYLTAPFVIQILYTKEFLPVLLIFQAALLAIIVKASAWPLAFIILAKGDRKQYFKQELVSDFLNVSLTILFYNYFGLVGIGIAMLLNYVLYGIYVYFIVNKKYNFYFRSDAFKIFIVSVILGSLCSAAVFFLQNPYKSIVIGIVFLLSLLFSYNSLDKRIGMKSIYFKIRSKLRR